MATTEDMSQSSAADGIKMLPKSDLVGKNQESRDIIAKLVNRFLEKESSS